MVPIIAPQKRTLLHIAVLQVFWQRSLQSQSIIWPDTPSPCRSLLFILHPFLEVHRHSVFVCLFLDESTVSIVELSVPGIDQKKEEWACPGCKGRGQALEGGAWPWRAGPGHRGRDRSWRAGPGRGGRARGGAPPSFPSFPRARRKWRCSAAARRAGQRRALARCAVPQGRRR